jgi:hypothetical protein
LSVFLASKGIAFAKLLPDRVTFRLDKDILHLFNVSKAATSIFVIRLFRSCGLWPPNSTLRNFKVTSSLRSPSAKANLFLAFGERKLLSCGKAA